MTSSPSAPSSVTEVAIATAWNPREHGRRRARERLELRGRQGVLVAPPAHQAIEIGAEGAAFVRVCRGQPLTETARARAWRLLFQEPLEHQAQRLRRREP